MTAMPEVAAPNVQRFIIASAARTGSTMLVHLIRSHPDTISNSEVMALDEELGGFDRLVRDHVAELGRPKALTKWRKKSPVDFMNQVALYPADAQAVGFKIKSEELVQPKYGPLLQALTDDRSLKIIHLNRTNLLERYVSWLMVNQVTGVTLAVSEDERPEYQQVLVDPIDAERDFEQAERRRAQMDEWFAGHDVLQVAYEDLVSRPAVESDRICDFLGLEPRLLTTRTIKLSPPVEALIQNYDELRAHFSGHRFEYLFDLPQATPPAVEAEPDPAAVLPANTNAKPPATVKVPAEVRRLEAYWGPAGSSLPRYLASLIDRSGLHGLSVLGIDNNTDMVEAVASGRCPVKRLVGLESTEHLLDYCADHIDDPVIELTPGNIVGEDDPTDSIHGPFDLVVVRTGFHRFGPEALTRLSERARSLVQPDARLVIAVPLLEPTTRGTDGVVDRIGAMPNNIADGIAHFVSKDPPIEVPIYTRDRLVALLAATGWRIDEFREPRRAFQHHFVATAV